MSRRPLTQHDAAGFTLVEVMTAMVVFLLGVAGAMQGLQIANEQIEDANHRQIATTIADEVLTRLVSSSRTAAQCFGATDDPIVADTIIGNSQYCFGTDVQDTAGLGGRFGCAPDHPQNAAELNQVAGFQIGALNTHQTFIVGTNGINGTNNLGSIDYRGQSYRVVWNVTCDAGTEDERLVDVIVGWGEPQWSMVGGKFVRLRSTKGSGF